MESVIFFLVLVVLSYAVAGYAFRASNIPFILYGAIQSGMGFIIIGMLVGPHVLGFLGHSELDRMMSLTPIALCWAGLVFGLQFRIHDLKLISRANFRMSAVQAIVVCGISFVLFLPVRYVGVDMIISFRQSLPLVFALASIACISSPTIVAAVIRRYRAHGLEERMLRYISSSDAVIGLIFFGISLAFFRTDTMAQGALLGGIFWLVATIVVGIILGLLYQVFLCLQLSSNERLVLSIAMIVFAAGVSSSMNVSPLFLSLIVGITLTNFSENKDRLFRLLVSAEKGFFGLMLILAGALSLGFEKSSLIIGIAFVMVRAFGKVCGANAAYKFVNLKGRSPTAFGLGLIGQGGMAIAIALDFIIRYPGWAGGVLLSSIVIAYIINALLSPYLVKRALIAEGGIA